MLDRLRIVIDAALWTAVGGLIVAAIALLAFMYSGIYDIAANEPHLKVVRWALTTFQMQSVHEHAEGIEAPPLDDPALVHRGFTLYRELCVVCHGAPGIERAVIGRGLNPDPPRLVTAIGHYNDAELYWIIRNGLKMTGMPAFSTLLTEPDLWALVAFTRRLPRLSQEEWHAMVAALDTVTVPGRPEPPEPLEPPEPVIWAEDEDVGWARLVEEGDPERGKALIDLAGCGTCHVIPGVDGARGMVGPPLTRWAERHFIAGSLVNTPDNLVAWIVEPTAVEPGTAMPDVGATAEQALDMAAYLFTLGEPPPYAQPEPDGRP